MTDELIEKTTKKVMKIINKHHYGLRDEVAIIKKNISKFENDFYRVEQRYDQIMKKLLEQDKELKNIYNILHGYSMGVQNVYNEFIKYKSAGLITAIEK